MEDKYVNIKKVIKEGMVGGKCISVNFIKKDGSLRKMNARGGVTKHLRGGKSTISGKEHLIGCYDMQSGGYRCINALTVLSVKCSGLPLQTFQTEDEAMANV